MKKTATLLLATCAMLLSCSKKKDSSSNPTGSQFTCGTTLTVTHTAGSIAPVTKTVKYGTVSSSLTGTAKCWITQNLGADHPATSFGDTSQAAAGWYWQFNRKQGYAFSGTTKIPSTSWDTDTTHTVAGDWNSANDPCTALLGTGWRMPTQLEWKNVLAAGGWTTGDAAYGSPLNLHVAGYIGYSGTLQLSGFVLYLWSINQQSSGEGYTFGIDLSTTPQIEIQERDKVTGQSLRCIKD